MYPFWVCFQLGGLLTCTQTHTHAQTGRLIKWLIEYRSWQLPVCLCSFSCGCVWLCVCVWWMGACGEEPTMPHHSVIYKSVSVHICVHVYVCGCKKWRGQWAPSYAEERRLEGIKEIFHVLLNFSGLKLGEDDPWGKWKNKTEEKEEMKRCDEKKKK